MALALAAVVRANPPDDLLYVFLRKFHWTLDDALGRPVTANLLPERKSVNLSSREIIARRDGLFSQLRLSRLESRQLKPIVLRSAPACSCHGRRQNNLAEVFRERSPVPRVPSRIEVAEIAFVETLVIENEFGSGRLRLELKFDQGVIPRLPILGTPRLDDPLIRNQLYVSPLDQPSERLERSASVATDLSRQTRERRELLGIQKYFVNPMRIGLEIDFLMKICQRFIRARALRLRHGLRLSAHRTNRKPRKSNGPARNHLSSSRRAGPPLNIFSIAHASLLTVHCQVARPAERFRQKHGNTSPSYVQHRVSPGETMPPSL